jgi:hypothetical protein
MVGIFCQYRRWTAVKMARLHKLANIGNAVL